MKAIIAKLSVLLLIISMFMMLGCDEEDTEIAIDQDPTQISTNTRILDVAEVFITSSIPVEGYALVGGLNDTGSAQCPVDIRSYLEQYILRKFKEPMDAGKFIESPKTAVVYVSGTIPALSDKNTPFDLKVSAIPGTQVKSLRGGILWGVDLKAKGKMGAASKTLANGEGALYMDRLDSEPEDELSAIVLGGAKAVDSYPVQLSLKKEDYKMTGKVRDRINERYGFGTAKATMAGQIHIIIPDEYVNQQGRFIALVKTTYITQSAQENQQRIQKHLNALIAGGDTLEASVSLEAIGTEARKALEAELNKHGSDVNLVIASLLTKLGSDEGLAVLRSLMFDTSNSQRLETLKAINESARRSDIINICHRLLRDKDSDIKLEAYKMLAKMEDVMVDRINVGSRFYIDQIAGFNNKLIYVSRSGRPGISLIGAPIMLRQDSFLVTDDGTITINAIDSEKVSISKQIPNKAQLQIDSSHNLADIIRSLCEEPTLNKPDQTKVGLNVSYADVVVIIKQLVEKNAVVAEFKASDMPAMN